MVKLIIGNKGSGKTKQLIESVEAAAAKTSGNVICIESGDALKFGLDHNIRLIDINEYQVSGADAYYGFIAGLMAGNYDITDIFGDATLKIIGDDMEVFADFAEKVAELTKNSDITVTLATSCDAASIPERIKGLIIG